MGNMFSMGRDSGVKNGFGWIGRLIWPILFWISLGWGQSIHLAYTSNLNCNLETCHCGGNDLGGMVQLLNAVDSLRARYSDLILLDSGDFLNTYTLPLANEVMIELVAAAKYDVLNAGDQEFVEGIDFLLPRVKRFNLPMISASIVRRESRKRLFPAYRILQRNGLRVAIVGVVPPQSFDFIEEPAVHIRQLTPVLKKILPEITEKSDLVVLLLHAGDWAAEPLLQTFPELNVVICGHTQEKVSRRYRGKLIVQAGQDGEYLGLLTVDKKKGGGFKISNQFMPVGPEYKENRWARERVNQYYESLKEKIR